MRTMTRLLIAPLLGLALAACSGDDDPPATDRDGGVVISDPRDGGVPRDGGTVRDGGTAMPSGFSLRPTLPRPPANGQLPADLLPPSR